MGTDLTDVTTSGRPAMPQVPTVPWIDPTTAESVVDVVQSLAADHPEAYAVILFGSVARREERPLDDPEPSDVDLLLLLDVPVTSQNPRGWTREQEVALVHTIGEADYRHRAPREIKFIFATRDLDRCDDLFVENVAHDGILLWARGPLPAPLAAIAERDPLQMSAASAR
jgi:predicted nucleotidyltransferase